MKTSLTKLALVALPWVSAAASAQVTQINLSPYVNTSYNIGAPVGTTTGNTSASLSSLTFSLLDPSTGSNAWIGTSSNASIDIKTDVVDPTTVYTLLNTLYGQNGVTNATVEFIGSGGAIQVVNLVGNTDIRDYNNWQWTNTINGTTTQEWWTNNQTPVAYDQSHRLDVQSYTLSPAFQSQTLTDIIISAPPGAGVNYMEPMLTGVDVQAAPVPLPATSLLMLGGLGAFGALAFRRRA